MRSFDNTVHLSLKFSYYVDNENILNINGDDIFIENDIFRFITGDEQNVKELSDLVESVRKK